MASIEQIIQRELNPFDSVEHRPGNFWREQQDPALIVESIHQEAITQIEAVLEQIAKDHNTRTMRLVGDSGSGKSYLLNRVKRALNPKAFFAYIGPWPDSDFIWRHILRQTVDSLLYVPEGQQESQLLLWLKGLSAFKAHGLMKKLLGERKLFINKFKATYPAGIYNANAFFSALYHLTKPESRQLACEWLKGDSLGEDSLKELGVGKCLIDNEDAAQKILANFGRISAETQPIVLCFDNLDNLDRTEDGFIKLQGLLSVNSTIHNEKLKNFLVIISIITNTWNLHSKRVQPADKARIDLPIYLKSITLDQAEALWTARLYALHRQAKPKPPSPIFPLSRHNLEQKYPGGKTDPRQVLELGRQLIQGYKLGGEAETDSVAAFKLLWIKEFNQTQETTSRIRDLSAPELIQMLKEALAALQVEKIQSRLLPSKAYANYSFSYQLPSQSKQLGVIWTEDPNMKTFCNVMKACQGVIQQNLCDTLQLIRAEGVGQPKLKGYQLHRQIFTGLPNCHIKPDLTSVRYLATYHNLVNAAHSRELLVAGDILSLEDLEGLIRESEILNECPLLRDLKIFSGNGGNGNGEEKLKLVKEFLLNLIKTQQLLGRQTLLQKASSQFPDVDEPEIDQVIQQLCQENKIQILGPPEKPKAQLVCLVPKG